jgi:hypothetical protein
MSRDVTRGEPVGVVGRGGRGKGVQCSAVAKENYMLCLSLHPDYSTQLDEISGDTISFNGHFGIHECVLHTSHHTAGFLVA